MGVVYSAAIDLLGYSCEAEDQPCGSPPLVVHHTRLLGVAVWQAKGSCNAQNNHRSRPHRPDVVIPVVAQPIQDLSAVSITHKTVGIALPRLWCGAIGAIT